MSVTLLHYNYMQSVCLHICVCVGGGDARDREVSWCTLYVCVLY